MPQGRWIGVGGAAVGAPGRRGSPLPGLSWQASGPTAKGAAISPGGLGRSLTVATPPRLPALASDPYIFAMTRPPKDTTPRPRPSRGKSGKPPAPPVEGLGGTPETKRSAKALGEPPQAPFLPPPARTFAADAGADAEPGEATAAPAPPAGSLSDRAGGRSTLPALRQAGAPSRSISDMTASLNALLARPHERSARAREVLAQQPMLAAHPLVSGGMPTFMPHRPPRPEKSEGGIPFGLIAEYEPRGDQPQAIAELVEGVNKIERNQVLLGVTGSGKTFSMAQVIQRTQRPALILAPNKTLAAQLYGEFKGFFPNNAVEYFVSYYDYYQPEAYVPRTDTDMDKEASITEQIDRMRHSATRALLERDDVIIVASVSCIYGIGSVETYTAMTFAVEVGETIPQRQLLADLVALHYRRSGTKFIRGTVRVCGDAGEVVPPRLEDVDSRIYQ